MEKDQNIDNQSQDGKPEEINSEDQNIGFKKMTQKILKK
jgi:hypothetical protein